MIHVVSDSRHQGRGVIVCADGLLLNSVMDDSAHHACNPALSRNRRTTAAVVPCEPQHVNVRLRSASHRPTRTASRTERLSSWNRCSPARHGEYPCVVGQKSVAIGILWY